MAQTIDGFLSEAYAAIAAAQKLADEQNRSFDFDLAYGMGGTYYPKKPTKMTKAEALKKLKAGNNLSLTERRDIANVLDEDDDYPEESGWHASSQSC